MSEKEEKTEVVLIEKKHLLFGAYAALRHAEKFLKSARDLNEKKDYQAAIPLATIAIEEAAKGIELAVRYRKFQDITKEEWEKLKTHKHKLVHAKESAVEILSKSTEEEDSKTLEELKKAGLPVSDINKERLIENVKKKAALHSQLQELRESCFYIDWDPLDEKWQLFDELPEKYQGDITFFCLEEADSEIGFLKLQIENEVNEIRKTGQLLKKLPFPSYTEYREMKDFESIKELNKEKPKLEKIKFQRGILAMQKFITLDSLGNVSLGIFTDTILKYFKLIKKQDDENWHPHPLIKSFMLALMVGKEKPEDGKKYGGYADDSDISPDGKPYMSFMTGVEYDSGIYTIEAFHHLGKKKEIPTEMVEKIIRTEIILEREPGDEVSFPLFVEAMSVIGLVVKALKKEDRTDAIRFTKELADKGNLENVPQVTVTEIKNIADSSEWDSLSSETRVSIATTYVSNKLKGKVDMVLTRDDIKEKKVKARWYIMTALESEYFESA